MRTLLVVLVALQLPLLIGCAASPLPLLEDTPADAACGCDLSDASPVNHPGDSAQLDLARTTGTPEPSFTPGTADGGACGGPLGDECSPFVPASITEMASAPALVFDGSDLVAAWFSTWYEISLARSTGGGTTFGPGRVITTPEPPEPHQPGDHPDRYTRSEPSLGTDESGTFWVAWVETDTGFASGARYRRTANVVVARSDDGGVHLGEPVTLASTVRDHDDNDPDQQKEFAHASVAIDPRSGAIRVSWARHEYRPGGHDPPIRSRIYVARAPSRGAPFGAPVEATDGNGIAYAAFATGWQRDVIPSLAAGADGGALVAWVEVLLHQWGSPENRVVTQRFDGGGARLGTQVVVSGPGDSPAWDRAPVAADPKVAGRYYVGFSSGDASGAWDVRAIATFDGGATFTPSARVNDDLSCATHRHLALAVDGTSLLHAAYTDNRNLTGTLHWTFSPPAGPNQPLAFTHGRLVGNPFPFADEEPPVLTTYGSTAFIAFTPRPFGPLAVWRIEH